MMKKNRKLKTMTPEFHMEDGMIVDNEGQYNHPGKNTRIKSDKITMDGVNTQVIGKTPDGMVIVMMPGDLYDFNGSEHVDEYPMAESGIEIKPSHKGLFTKKAKAHGMSVQEFANYVLSHKEDFPTETIKQANFARNAKKWNHKQDGGQTIPEEPYSQNTEVPTTDIYGNPTTEYTPEELAILDRLKKLKEKRRNFHYTPKTPANPNMELKVTPGDVIKNVLDIFKNKEKEKGRTPGVMSFQDGGYIETELSPQEIEILRQSGFDIEEL